jgi:prepilin signal peptidase PulO-like enzyme (type II secretory pathway)
MMQILNAFSIADLLAYLFPGILSLSGIYLILFLTPFRPLLKLPQDVGTSLVFLVISYIIGVLISTITDMIFREHRRSIRRKQNKGTIQIHDEKLKEAVVSAFNDLFLNQRETGSKKISQPAVIKEWNEDHYYICRSLVTELMPKAAASGLREGAYRQLRMNLAGSVAIWGVAGVLWGSKFLSEPNFLNEITGTNILINNVWAIALIISSIIACSYLIAILRRLMDKHEQREVREILTSFLAGYKMGIFQKR